MNGCGHRDEAGGLASQERERLFPVSESDLRALRGELSRQAERKRMVDVAYRIVDTPVGPLLLAGTIRGLVRVAYAREGFEKVLEALASTLSPRVLEEPDRLDVAARELDEYFSGERRVFDMPLDRSLSSGFRATVQRFLPRIGYGKTLTYRQVAVEVGNARAVRAVGSACATNPLPIVVPCHRVMRTDGGLGGYIGGMDIKRRLLEMERNA